MKRSEAVLSQMRAVYHGGALASLTDRELLERFAGRDGEAAGAALSALVERHGPMVLRVCRSSLRDEHDADDAFQAVFLVLVRKARSLWVRDSLGPWLHAVAVRTSARVRAEDVRRRARERRRGAREAVVACPAEDDVLGVVNEEVARLPGRLRDAVVLCDLEGLSHDEAARRLGCPLGTVKSRQARGRVRLRARLSRRGVGPETVTPVIATPLRPVAESLSSAVVRAAGAVKAGRLVRSGVVASRAVSVAREVSRGLMMKRVLSVVFPAFVAFTILAGAALLAAGRPRGQVPSAPPSSGRPAPPETTAQPRPPSGSVLQFRVVADRKHDANALEGPNYRWVKVYPRRQESFEGLVTREEAGKVTAVLVRLDPQNVTERDVERVTQNRGERGEPSILINLTPDGGRRLGALTRAHLPEDGGAFKYQLAVIADGVVLSVPIILAEIRDAAVIEFGGVPGTEEINALFRRLREAAAYNAPPPTARAVNDQAEALRETETVDLPALAGANRVTIDSASGSRFTLADPRRVDAIRRTLRPRRVPPEGGEVAATLGFYLDDTLIRRVSVHEGGEWGFERPGKRWSTGSDAELWRLVKGMVAK